MLEIIKFNTGGVVNWYDHFVAADIELISAYIEQSEISTSFAIKEFNSLKKFEFEEVNDYNAIITTSFRGIDGSLFEAKDIYENVFPMLNRHSLLVTVMSMFELRFIKLCDWINTHFNLNASLKRDKGSLLKQIRTYLINKAGLKFNTKMEEAWNELLALQSIRNKIIHNYGKYESKNVFIDKYIGSNKNISINVSNEFIFNHEFLKDLVPNFKTLCKELQEAMRDKSNNN